LLQTNGGIVKKNLILTVAVVFTFMAMTNLVMAGSGCGVSKAKTSAVGCAKTCAVPCGTKVDDKAKTDGKLIGAKVDCDYKGKCEAISLNITGMTCDGCESSITTALMNQDGVIKVVSIDHKTGLATVCFDPTKVESDNLAKLVTKKGYKAEIIPAVTTSEPGETKVKPCGVSAGAGETEKKDY
jgi:copper chaperone